MNPEQQNLFLYTASYCFFFAFLGVAKKKGANRILNSDGQLVKSPLLLLLHAAGIILFGLLPFFIKHPAPLLYLQLKHFWSFPSLVASLLIGLMLWISVRLANRHTARGPVSHNPPAAFSGTYLALYVGLRSLFIAAYEVWFRGFLLHDTLVTFGIAVTVGSNILLYVLLHTVNGKQEMVGCIPFGLVLCLLTLWQGTVWPAVFLHLALTLPYERTLIKLQQPKTLPHESFSHRRIRLYRA